MAKKEEESGPTTDPDAWMGTLSDLIFLLITFFVLLLTMSSLDAKSIKKVFGFFDDASNVLNFPQETQGSNDFMESLRRITTFMATTEEQPEDGELLRTTRQSTKDFLSALARTLQGQRPSATALGTLKLLAQRTGGEVKVEAIDRGIAVEFPGRILFPEGNDSLDEQGFELISELSTILKIWGGKVEVVAYWSWHQGPAILSAVVEAMERNWIRGKLINPILNPVAKRTIRFVLKERS